MGFNPEYGWNMPVQQPFQNSEGLGVKYEYTWVSEQLEFRDFIFLSKWNPVKFKHDSIYWYRQVQMRLQAYKLPGKMVDLHFWWYFQVELLLETFIIQVVPVLVNDVDLWYTRVHRLFESFICQVAEMPMVGFYIKTGSGLVLYKHLQLLFATFISQGIPENFGYQWYRQVQLLSETFILQEMLVNIEYSWFQALQDEFKQPYFIKLSEYVIEERKQSVVLPRVDEVFSWTRFCTPYAVKVVILGQDPYTDPRKAHGLCFSVKRGYQGMLPISLKNIFEVLKNNKVGFEIPQHGSLISWAKQGVLLLNACLTVRAGPRQAKSHANKGWEIFTDAVISWLSKNRHHIVFMLWGGDAQEKGAYIDQSKHLILKASHPSYYSYNKTDKPFSRCSHFLECNVFLTLSQQNIIIWNSLKSSLE